MTGRLVITRIDQELRGKIYAEFAQLVIVDSSTKSKQLETNMSLGNTSRAGTPWLDELVPSRYALKVGSIDVIVVSDGVLSLPGAMLGHNADPAVRAAWREDKFLPQDVFEWALNAVVVRSGDRTILIDAGIGADPGLNLGPATAGRQHRSCLCRAGSQRSRQE